MLGAWPDPVFTDRSDRLSKCRFVIVIVLIILFVCGPQTAYLFIIWGNIDLMTENLAMANMTVITALIKLLFVGYHREALRPLLTAFMVDWKGEKSEVEKTVMQRNGYLSRNISIGCTLLTQLTVTSFLALRIVALLRMDRNATDPDRAAIYPAYYPYDPRKSPAFELTICAQVAGSCCAAASSTAVDSFVSMLVLHNCGQFSKLHMTLEDLFNVKGQSRSRTEFRKALGTIVKRHEHLNWFAKTIEDCFNVLLLAQMLTSIVELCFQGFQAFGLTKGDEENFSFFELAFVLIHISYVIVHVYLYCYVGEMLLVQTTGLSYAAYESKWYHAPTSEASELLIIMLRTSIPLRLTTGKFGTLSLEMFSGILKTSMGYLSVLLTVANH